MNTLRFFKPVLDQISANSTESVPFPVTVIKYPDESYLREKGFMWVHSSQVQSAMVRECCWQEHEAVGGGASLVREQGGEYPCCLPSLCHAAQDTSPIIGWLFPSLLT